jgi:hypothetical protein
MSAARDFMRSKNRHGQEAEPSNNGKPQPPEPYPEGQRGDAWEGEPANGKASDKGAIFPDPIPISRLEADPMPPWVWHGFLARGTTTLLSALWKSGKTTLMSHLIKAMEKGGDFCGHLLVAGHVVYISEEPKGKWVERREKLGLKDHIDIHIRPFKTKPNTEQWLTFLAHLGDFCRRRQPDLIVFDCLSNLWPVRDENDACQVQSALMPLHTLTEGAALMLVHHPRKSDGQEATASRGSGALTAFVDIILELRRFKAENANDKRRTLTGYGRYDETPAETVVELTEEGYKAEGTRREATARELNREIVYLLPNLPPGKTRDELLADWSDEVKPRKQTLLDALDIGANGGEWRREGEGKKGSPYRYWVPPPP